MMLRSNNIEGSDYGSSEAGSYLHDEDDNFIGDVNDNDADDLQNPEHDGSDVVVDDYDEDEDEDEDEEDDNDDDDDEDEDAFDVHAHDEVGEDNNPIIEYDSDVFSSDEAYARALQDAEERDMAARLLGLSGINDRECIYFLYISL